VLVVDEAGMVGSRQMMRLTELVVAAGARLILVGDERQLQPILAAGGPFASIGDRVGRATLTEIQRQRAPWVVEAIKNIPHGSAREALKEYASRGFLTVTEDRTEARKALIKSWQKAGAANPKDNLMLAGTNADVNALNSMAQFSRLLSGELGKQCLSVAGTRFQNGDRILFTRNSKRLGVENGCLGTILEVDVAHQILTVRLDKGKHVLIPVKDYEHLKLGYAVTTHKAQGVTTENSYVLLGGPTQDRELSYMQASRARGNTHFFTDRSNAGDSLYNLSKQLERSRQKDLAHDLLIRWPAQRREESNGATFGIS